MKYSKAFLKAFRMPIAMVGKNRNPNTTSTVLKSELKTFSFYDAVLDIINYNVIPGYSWEERFTATASQTTFTTAKSLSAVSGTYVPVMVFRNGTKLKWVASAPTGRQFTYSDTTITLPASTVGDEIEVVY